MLSVIHRSKRLYKVIPRPISIEVDAKVLVSAPEFPPFVPWIARVEHLNVTYPVLIHVVTVLPTDTEQHLMVGPQCWILVTYIIQRRQIHPVVLYHIILLDIQRMLRAKVSSSDHNLCFVMFQLTNTWTDTTTAHLSQLNGRLGLFISEIIDLDIA